MSSAMQLMNAAVRASMTSMVMDNAAGHQLQAQQDQGLRMQEVLLRSQAEAALRLAVTQAVVASTSSADNGLRGPQQNQGYPGQVSPDLTEALRLQEQRLEQALRLHGDPRALGFSLSANSQQHHLNP